MMHLVPIEEVQHNLRPGVGLPWNVRNAQGALLLAKGLMVTDDNMVTALMQRGAFVDASDLHPSSDNDEDDRESASLAHRWFALEAKLGTVLRSMAHPSFLQRVREAVAAVSAMSTDNSDELVFLIVRHDHSRYAGYGVSHSLHTATLCGLLARRLDWSEEDRTSLVGAALTMNLSMLDLQGALAASIARPTPAEREQIQQHPLTSALSLREAGLSDDKWLTAVEQHHEIVGGGGYPHGLLEPGEMSQLVRFIDTFTAKHSPRVGRKPLPAQQAARDLFLQSSRDPMASLLIKELGIYPPGCYVKLASGELAVVTHRGESVKTPLVAALTNRNGDALAQPIPRDTSRASHAITGTVPDEAVKLHVSVEYLYERRTTHS
jgi:HD-GYP domain-containing protein (c-di-GMP phosphodiesterase class II)